MSGYIWYSFGSDTTGPSLAKALGFESGKKRPDFQEYEVVIGFGCKPKSLVGPIPGIEEGSVRILNHPDEVQNNRNKAATLQRLNAAGINTPGAVYREGQGGNAFYSRVEEAIDSGELHFPLVGQTANHEGEAFFCYTLEDVHFSCITSEKQDALVDYFRSFCPGTEFRIHVLRDTAIFGQVKTLSENPVVQTTDSLRSQLLKRMKKSNPDLSMDGAGEWVLKQLVPELIRGPGQLLRSVGRGWVMEDIDLGLTPKAVITEAINAVEAAGLDLGAVSVTFDENVPRVTNITSAPAISATMMPSYVEALEEFMKDGPKARKVTKKTTVKSASPELIARFTRKLREADAEKIEELLRALG